MSKNVAADEAAKAAVFVKSEDIDQLGYKRIFGPMFGTSEAPLSVVDLMKSYETIGFQATGLTRAIDIINQMRNWTSDEDEDEKFEIPEGAEEEFAEFIKSKNQKKCTIMLGYTSNLVSSGLREVIRFLVQHNHISGIVTTAGGIEEDIIKCLGNTYLAPEGRFDAFAGSDLRKRGINRIGNLLVPNDNYCRFEDWVIPILDKMVQEQVHDKVKWSPSSVIRRLGLEINDPDSILYWAAKNDIPVFCPALTDGSFGDMLYFHTYKAEPEPLNIDIVSDIRRINDMSVRAKKAGMIILGGGVCKHQIANSMLFRNGADYAVYINTGQEFDGSDSGARPDEAVSWGKIRAGAESVKIYADATIVFPLLVAATWAKDHSLLAVDATKNREDKQNL